MTTEDDRRDPVAERLHQAANRAEQEKVAAAGEQLLASDFAANALKLGLIKLEELEQQLIERCESINRDKPSAIPDFTYNKPAHRIEAGKFSLRLEFFQNYDPYRFYMVVGLHPEAHMFMAEIPDVEATTWRFFAYSNEEGFFWKDIDSGEELQNEEIVERGLNELTNLLESDLKT